MANEISRQAALADIQKQKVRARVLETRQAIRSQIKGSFDKKTGCFSYVMEKDGRRVEKSRFYESDFLRHSGIDKNTLKQDYHRVSRDMVVRLVVWVNAKISKDKPKAGGARKSDEVKGGDAAPYHTLIAAERDAIAEKFAILEIELSDALRGKRLVEQKLEDIKAELARTRDNVASLTNLLLKIGADHPSNVVPISPAKSHRFEPDKSQG